MYSSSCSRQAAHRTPSIHSMSKPTGQAQSGPRGRVWAELSFLDAAPGWVLPQGSAGQALPFLSKPPPYPQVSQTTTTAAVFAWPDDTSLNFLLRRAAINGNNLIEVKQVNGIILWFCQYGDLLQSRYCGLIECKFSAWTFSKWIKKYLFYIKKQSA